MFLSPAHSQKSLVTFIFLSPLSKLVLLVLLKIILQSLFLYANMYDRIEIRAYNNPETDFYCTRVFVRFFCIILCSVFCAYIRNNIKHLQICQISGRIQFLIFAVNWILYVKMSAKLCRRIFIFISELSWVFTIQFHELSVFLSC